MKVKIFPQSRYERHSLLHTSALYLCCSWLEGAAPSLEADGKLNPQLEDILPFSLKGWERRLGS